MARLIQTSVDLIPSLKIHHCDRTGHRHIVSALFGLGEDTGQKIYAAIGYSGEYYNIIELNQLGDEQLSRLYNCILPQEGCEPTCLEIVGVLRARAQFRSSLNPRRIIFGLLMNELRKKFEEVSDGLMYHGLLLKHARELGQEDLLRGGFKRLMQQAGAGGRSGRYL